MRQIIFSLLLSVKLFALSDILYDELKKANIGLFERDVKKCVGYDYVLPEALPLIFYFVIDEDLKKIKEYDDVIYDTASLLLCYYRDDLDFERLYAKEIKKYFGKEYFQKIKKRVYLTAKYVDDLEDFKRVAKYLDEPSLPHFVVKSDNIELMKRILNRKNINQTDSKGFMPLHYARSKKALKILEKLGANIYEKSSDGKNLLLTHVSTHEPIDMDFVEYLIKRKKFSPTSKDNSGNNMLHLAKTSLSFAYLVHFNRNNLYEKNRAGIDPLEMIVNKQDRAFLKEVLKHAYIPYIEIIDRLEF